MSITDLLREGFQRHGDSPTVKHYTDWGVYRDVFESLANGELGLERKILVEASGGVRIEGRGEISLYEQNSNLSKYHMILSNEAIVAGFHGGKGFINVKPVAEAGVNIGNLIARIDSPGTLVLKVVNNVSNGLLLFGLNINVADNVEASIIVDVEEAPGSASSINFRVGTGRGSISNLVFLVSPGRMMRMEGLVKPGDNSLVLARLTGVLNEDSRIDAVVDGLIDGLNTTLNLYSTLYLSKHSTGSVRGRGTISSKASDARLVYGFESILEEEAVAYMQPFLEVNSNRVLEARHYARNYLVTVDKLFYLATRGLSFSEAKNIVLTGLLTSLMPGELRSYCYSEIKRRMRSLPEN